MQERFPPMTLQGSLGGEPPAARRQKTPGARVVPAVHETPSEAGLAAGGQKKTGLTGAAILRLGDDRHRGIRSSRRGEAVEDRVSVRVRGKQGGGVVPV